MNSNDWRSTINDRRATPYRALDLRAGQPSLCMRVAHLPSGRRKTTTRVSVACPPIAARAPLPGKAEWLRRG